MAFGGVVVAVALCKTVVEKLVVGGVSKSRHRTSFMFVKMQFRKVFLMNNTPG